MEVMDVDTTVIDTDTFNLCRLCVEQPGKYQIGPRLSEQISECFDIKVKPFDGLSQIICSQCQIVVGEFHQARKNFKEKQASLFDRRRRLLNQESLTSDNICVTSTSTHDVSSSPSPVPAPYPALSIALASPPIHSLSSSAVSPAPINPHAQKVYLPAKNSPSSLAKSIASNHPKLTIKAVKRSSSSSSLPPNSTSSIGETTVKLISSPPSAESFSEQVLAVSSSARVPATKPMPKTWSMSKFHCVFCDKAYMKSSNLRKHRINLHNCLYKKTCAITKPCSIKLDKIFAEVSAPTQRWVRLKQGSGHQYNPAEPFQYTVHFSTSKVSDETLDISSSDEEIVNKSVLKKPRLEPIQAYNISDSDSRNSFPDSAAVQTEDSNKSEDVDVEKDMEPDAFLAVAEPKDKLGLESAEFLRIVQMCWRMAMARKSLTAPLTKPWLIETIKANTSVDVVWVYSSTIKVSMVKSLDSDKQTKDPLALLPSYNSRKRQKPATGHLKLKRTAKTQETDKSNRIVKIPIQKSPVTAVPQNTVRIPIQNTLIGLLNNPPTNKSPKPTAAVQKVTSDPTETSVVAVNSIQMASDVSYIPQIQHFVRESQNPNPTFEVDSTHNNLATIQLLKTVSKLPILIPCSNPNSGSSKTTTVMLRKDKSENSRDSDTYSIQTGGVTKRLKIVSPEKVMRILPKPPQESEIRIFSTKSLAEERAPIASAPPTSAVSTPAVTSSPAPLRIQCKPMSALMASPPAPVLAPVPPPPTFLNNTLKEQEVRKSPLLSQPTLIQDSTVCVPSVSHPIVICCLYDLIETLNIHNVILTTDFTPDMVVSELVRFILTIRESSSVKDTYITYEFLVGVHSFGGNRLLVTVQDQKSECVNLSLWTTDFQIEMIKTFKKPDFQQQLLKTASNLDSEVKDCVTRFIQVVNDYPAVLVRPG